MNGNLFYQDINVTTKGVSVYASGWPLSGQTEIAFTPSDLASVGPIVNAGEIFQILPLGGRTLTKDGMEIILYNLWELLFLCFVLRIY